jgi:predicted Rossmann fold flavoprotein
VGVRVIADGKTAAQMRGEMLFTESGVSGPLILSLSKDIVALLEKRKAVSICIDLKPALDHDVLDRRLLREIEEHGKQGLKRMLKSLLPQSMITVFIDLLGIPGDKPCCDVNAVERKQLRLLLKEFTLPVQGHRPISEAIVTSGGIALNEVSPSSMESKIVPGLYFAGEVLDLDADTGGYNLQMAFSTGWVAGTAIRNG